MNEVTNCRKSPDLAMRGGGVRELSGSEIWEQSPEQRFPIFLAPGSSFTEDNFSTDRGRGDDSSTWHLLCTLLLLLLHQLHLRSSGIRLEIGDPCSRVPDYISRSKAEWGWRETFSCEGFLKCPDGQLKLHYRFSPLIPDFKKKGLENSPI